jgi:hypothetical protein
MKYDLKAMGFSPDVGTLFSAFTWANTPEGYSYWSNQCRNGLIPEGKAKWDAMKRQWNEENGVSEREVGTARELDLQVGDVVEYGGFEGAVTSVELIPLGEIFGGQTRIEFDNYGSVIFCGEQITVISRAKPLEDIASPDSMFPMNCRCTITRPQRYVVVTDDDTIICTRAEAEDLAAGGVDAVYKLGDKVEVTVKVEFE